MLNSESADDVQGAQTRILRTSIPHTYGLRYAKPRLIPGSYKPMTDNLWWKNQRYAEENNNRINNDGKAVMLLDFMKQYNRRAHHTERYGVANLVVRRGQPFKLTLQLILPFDSNRDRIQFIFSKGERPQESKGTLVRIDVYNDKQLAERAKLQPWVGYISSITATHNGCMIDIIIKPACNALVGKYTVKTKLFEPGINLQKTRFVKEEEEEVFVLFNAWCRDDQVYLKNEDERQEYVLNETGQIWVGNSKANSGRAWNYGQFSKYSLEAAVYLLDKCKTLGAQGHGNVTLVVRAFSAMANSYDNDGGVLGGNWSGDYSGGVPPTQWNGSQAILQQYMLTKREVKYGQCWVFSGLLTTLGRTMGIPTRSVTNFESGHDRDCSLTINKHFSNSGKPLSDMDDSVWNFHVWNESWFKRPDLPHGYDGWQVYDSTPQEASEGIMRCGPAPVKAIKDGNVYLDYDTKFIFAEVNGDCVNWLVTTSGDMFVCSTEPSTVGYCVSTKQVGSNSKQDITDIYKYPEGSAEERETVSRASRYSSRAEQLWDTYSQTATDVHFSYSSDAHRNGDIEVTLLVENTSSQQRTIYLTVTATAAYYTGIPGEELSSEMLLIELQSSQKTEKKWYIQAESYLNLIDDDAKVKLYFMAKVEETHQVYVKAEVFEINKPDLQLEVYNKKMRVGEPFEVAIKMCNPLDVKLTGCIIRLEGPGIQKNMKIPIHRSISPGELFTEMVQLTGKYPGNREIIACFNCRQLTNIHGCVTMDII